VHSDLQEVTALVLKFTDQGGYTSVAHHGNTVFKTHVVIAMSYEYSLL